MFQLLIMININWVRIWFLMLKSMLQKKLQQRWVEMEHVSAIFQNQVILMHNSGENYPNLILVYLWFLLQVEHQQPSSQPFRKNILEVRKIHLIFWWFWLIITNTYLIMAQLILVWSLWFVSQVESKVQSHYNLVPGTGNHFLPKNYCMVRDDSLYQFMHILGYSHNQCLFIFNITSGRTSTTIRSKFGFGCKKQLCR